jgi:membrane-bound lytic murein transglycosylase D
LRLRSLLTLGIACALAACAAPGPQPPSFESVVAALPLLPPLPAPSPSVEPVALPAFAPEPFPVAASAELEALPVSTGDLWDRIVEGYAIPDLVDDPLVAKWEKWYSERPDYVARMVERSRRYLYHIVVEIDARKMPLDLALLPMVESAFNPNAMSTSRASGIWQFMPSTGKHYGLQQNWWFDSRRDVVAATGSAVDYLQKLYFQFDDWQLALASYNWGEGNVARAVQRNKAKGLPTDFSSLTNVPAETQNYLPKLQALKNIIRDPAKYGLTLADVPDTPYFTVVKVTKKMDVKRAADLAEMPLDEFMSLNPQHNRPVIAGADEYTILLPIDKAELFAAKLELSDQPLVSWQAYRMKNAETLQAVAAKYGMSVETLRAINGIGSRAKPAPGHTLLVPAERPSEANIASLSTAVFTSVPQGRTFYYQVRRGDTMASIAARYGVSATDLRHWNGLSQNAVQVGQNLRITSDSAPAAKPRTSSKRSATARATAKPATTNPAPKPRAATSRSAPAPTARAGSPHGG